MLGSVSAVWIPPVTATTYRPMMNEHGINEEPTTAQVKTSTTVFIPPIPYPSTTYQPMMNEHEIITTTTQLTPDMLVATPKGFETTTSTTVYETHTYTTPPTEDSTYLPTLITSLGLCTLLFVVYTKIKQDEIKKLKEELRRLRETK